MKVKMSDKFFYRVEDCDFDIFKEFNSSKDNVVRNNGELKFYQGEWVEVKVNDFISHFVKPTETLEVIANQYSTTKDKIVKDNNLKDNKLFIGQLLKIYK